jgi:hypothetical protein
MSLTREEAVTTEVSSLGGEHPYQLKTNVDRETLRANMSRKVGAGPIRVYQDPDGFEIVEQSFSDGSMVMMHMAQYQAITYEVASNPELIANILYVHGDGPKPDALL